MSYLAFTIIIINMKHLCPTYRDVQNNILLVYPKKKNSLASRHQYANFVIFSMLQNLYKFSPSYEPEKILEYSE